MVLELNGDHVGVSSRPVNQKAADVSGGSATAQERMKGHAGQRRRWVNGVGVKHECVCVHAACVFSRPPGAHGVLALLTHHVQNQPHQEQSAAGGMEEGMKTAEGMKLRLL